MPEPANPSIDERIQALTMNLELLLKHSEEQDRRMDKLQRVVEEHEQEWDRFRRALRAGLDEYLGNGNGGEDL